LPQTLLAPETDQRRRRRSPTPLVVSKAESAESTLPETLVAAALPQHRRRRSLAPFTMVRSSVWTFSQELQEDGMPERQRRAPPWYTSLPLRLAAKVPHAVALTFAQKLSEGAMSQRQRPPCTTRLAPLTMMKYRRWTRTASPAWVLVLPSRGGGGFQEAHEAHARGLGPRSRASPCAWVAGVSLGLPAAPPCAVQRQM
jgi:hypothetical protein